MSGKDAIISRILQDAETRANGIRSEAAAKAKEITDEAQHIIDLRLGEFNASTEEYFSAADRRAVAIAELDAKRHALNGKQNVISEVFAKAKESLLSDDRAYVALMKRLIEENAEEGETLVISARDRERLGEAFVSSLGVKLTLSKDFGAFDGGVLLSTDGYDKNLTLDVLLEEVKRNRLAEIAAVLFAR